MKAAALTSSLGLPGEDSWVSVDVEPPVSSILPREEPEDALVYERASVPAFDEVYDQHLDFVWRALRGLGIPAPLLDDAVQDVFVVVHRRLCTFEGRSKMTTWLFGIALRVARNYRRERRFADDPSAVERVSDERPSPFEEAARSEAVQLLERVLDALDDKKRIVFVLMELEQMTAEEVAALLEVNVNTVYSRRRFARMEFDRLVALHGKGGK